MKPSALTLLPAAALFAAHFAAVPAPVSAQQGDREGHVMKPPPAHWKIPPAPVVPADQAAATMTLEEGFELELIASEPMVQDPVAICFDGDGRLWVAEMRGYMPDIDGKLEDSTYGRISVLEDLDGDGIMDKSTVFLEDYLLPRSVALTDADRTLLFADNLKLYSAEILRDEKGGIRAGRVEVIDEAFAEGGNPEHKSNGLLRALDNWIYNAKCDRRYKKVDGAWIQEKTEERGQWGIVQDNYGRLLSNTNSNLVSVEEVPPGVRIRNPHHVFRSKVVSTVADQSLWPGRINPGVNRGYLEGTLDEEGYLQKPTAVSGLVFYRGDQFPEAYRGGIFVPEPSGNLVKRLQIEEGDDGMRTVKSALQGREFLTSTDERNRIVSASDSPDGSLYLVDLYRGILQHRVYMTSYLRAQVLDRGLDQHIHLGRIWRVRHRDGKKESVAPRLSGASAAELVALLSHPNGWWRDTAQRFLVERGGDEAVPLLRRDVAAAENEFGVIHALWTLEGLGSLDPDTLDAALSGRFPRAAAEAVRAAESAVGGPRADEVFELLAARSTTGDLPLRRQLAASLGLFGEKAVPVLASLLVAAESDLLLGDLAMSGSSGRELALFKALPASHPLRGPLVEILVKRRVRAELDELTGLVSTPQGFGALARSHTRLRHADDALRLLERVADEKTEAAIRRAIVGGFLAGAKDKKFKPMPVKELKSLELALDRGLVDAAQHKALAALFKVGTGEEEVFLVTEEHKRQYKEGEAQYQRICLGCHQVHGNGQTFLAPPLVGSEWVLESEKSLIALVLDGVMGPIEVLGKTYTVPEIQPLMPGLRANPDFTNAQLAAIMTYVRNAWGNAAPPVTAGAVKAYRDEVAVRGPWTAEELKSLKSSR